MVSPKEGKKQKTWAANSTAYIRVWKLKARTWICAFPTVTQLNLWLGTQALLQVIASGGHLRSYLSDLFFQRLLYILAPPLSLIKTVSQSNLRGYLPGSNPQFRLSNKIQFSTFRLHTFSVDSTLVKALSLGGFFSLSLTFQSTCSRRWVPVN